MDVKKDERIIRYVMFEDADKFFSDRLAGLLKKTGALDSVSQVEINLFCKNEAIRVSSYLSLASTVIPSEEALYYALGRLFHHAFADANMTLKFKTGHAVEKLVKTRLTTPNRMIRFLASAFDDQPAVPDARVAQGKTVNRPMARWIVECLDKMPSKVSQIQCCQRQGIERFMPRSF